MAMFISLFGIYP